MVFSHPTWHVASGGLHCSYYLSPLTTPVAAPVTRQRPLVAGLTPLIRHREPELQGSSIVDDDNSAFIQQLGHGLSDDRVEFGGLGRFLALPRSELVATVVNSSDTETERAALLTRDINPAATVIEGGLISALCSSDAILTRAARHRVGWGWVHGHQLLTTHLHFGSGRSGTPVVISKIIYLAGCCQPRIDGQLAAFHVYNRVMS